MLQFLIKHKGSVSEDQLLSIFRRINKKADACINFDEFVCFMCTSQMNPDKILKKQHLQGRKSAELTKKPLVSPVVRHLENERRSKSPLLKDISMLSKKSLQRELEATRKRQLHSLVAKSYKHRDHSPLSRSGMKPTPTVSARRKSLTKLSASRLRKSTSRPKVLKVSKDKPMLLQSRTEMRINTPLPQVSSHRAGHSNSAGRSQESSRRSGRAGRTGGLQSDKNKIEPQQGSYLEQRRSEYKQQRSESKPKATESGRQQGSPSSKKQSMRATKAESSSKSINRKLKYEELKERSPRQDLAGKRVLVKQASPQSSKKSRSRGNSGKKVQIAPSVLAASTRHRQHETAMVNADQRHASGDQSLGWNEQRSLAGADTKGSRKNLNDQRDHRRQLRSDLEGQSRNEMFEVTPSKLVDSLELAHSTFDPKNYEEHEHSIRGSMQLPEGKYKEIDLVKGYDTVRSEVSFSEQKRGIEHTDTPKFDSGVQQVQAINSTASGASQKDIDRLCMIFKKIIVFYERIEELKNQVFNDKEFRLCDHFWSFDFENKGYLTLNEFTQLFNSFNINIGKGEIVEYLKLVLKRPNINQHTRLVENDIAKCFAPLNQDGNLLMYCSNSDRHQSMPQYEIRPSVAVKLDEIVQLQIKMHCEVIKECKMLNHSSQKRLFAVISDSDVISWDALTRFLSTQGVKFYEDDVIFIFREFDTRKAKAMAEAEYSALFRLYSTAGL